MIFVTVGTTHFDPLIREIDELIAQGRIQGRVVCQIGSGSYEPAHAEHFRFAPSLDPWYAQADLVVCHGGATVMSLLQMRKRLVAIANTELAGDHQTAFLTRLAKSVPFPWSRAVEDVSGLIDVAIHRPPPRINLPHLAEKLKRSI